LKIKQRHSLVLLLEVVLARYWAIAKGVFFPSEPGVTSCALGSGQIPQRQKFRLVIAKPALQLLDEEGVCKSPEARRRTMKRICTLATVLFLGTAYAGQTEGIKEAENVAVLYMKAYPRRHRSVY